MLALFQIYPYAFFLREPEDSSILGQRFPTSLLEWFWSSLPQPAGSYRKKGGTLCRVYQYTRQRCVFCKPLTNATCCLGIRKNNNESFAIKRCKNVGALQHILTTSKPSSDIEFLINTHKRSATKRKKREDNGSSWRNPLEGMKDSNNFPLNYTKYLTEETHAVMQEIQLWKKPSE